MSWYLDLDQISQYTDPAASAAGQSGKGTTKRVYHHTAPVSMVMALHAGLGVLLDEGLEESWAPSRQVRELFWRRVSRSSGSSSSWRLRTRLPQLTTVWVPTDLPSGMDEAAVRSELLQRYSIEIGSGSVRLQARFGGSVAWGAPHDRRMWSSCSVD